MKLQEIQIMEETQLMTSLGSGHVVSGWDGWWIRWLEERKSGNWEAKALERFSTKGIRHEEQGEKVGKNIISLKSSVIRTWKLWNVFVWELQETHNGLSVKWRRFARNGAQVGSGQYGECWRNFWLPTQHTPLLLTEKSLLNYHLVVMCPGKVGPTSIPGDKF